MPVDIVSWMFPHCQARFGEAPLWPLHAGSLQRQSFL
jgi:hypothetical protein